MLTAAHFDELCSHPPVRERAEALLAERKAALRRFWIYLAAGLAISLGTLFFLGSLGWITTAWFLFIIGLVASFIAAWVPISAVTEALKQPALSKLAQMSGMEFIAADFDPPAYHSVTKLLFGHVSSAVFTDLFHGVDDKGQGKGFYEAALQGRVGRHTYEIFSGQIYAFQHQGAEGAYTVLRSDRGVFNFFRPARDMERVTFAQNEAFERKFEVYSTNALVARQLFEDRGLQDKLLEWRLSGRIFICLTPTEALFAISGKNRFEPGSMFRRRAALDRVRLMFDDFGSSMQMLQSLHEQLRVAGRQEGARSGAEEPGEITIPH